MCARREGMCVRVPCRGRSVSSSANLCAIRWGRAVITVGITPSCQMYGQAEQRAHSTTRAIGRCRCLKDQADHQTWSRLLPPHCVMEPLLPAGDGLRAGTLTSRCFLPSLRRQVKNTHTQAKRKVAVSVTGKAGLAWMDVGDV